MGRRDIGDQRRQDRRDRRSFAAPRPARSIDATGLHILPGVIDTQVHFREPGATHKEDLEIGLARGGARRRHGRLRNAQHQSADDRRRSNSRTRSPRATHRMHCDFAFWVGGTHENVKDIPELERLPGAAGIKVFMGSSTGSLLVADDAGVAAILGQDAAARRLPFRGRISARRTQGPCAWRAIRPRIRSGATRRRRSLDAAAGAHRARATRGDPCAACLDGGRDRLSRAAQGHRQRRGDAAASDLERRRLCAARHAGCR